MKVCLIHPQTQPDSPFFRIVSPPMGLMCIAAVLEGEGHEVSIVDDNLLRLKHRDLVKRIREWGPELLGISSTSASFAAALHLATSLKNALPQVPLVMGGPHVNARYEEVIRYPEVDVVVYGEGEYTMRELCCAIEGDGDLSAIRGLGFKRDGQAMITPPRPLIENLDELPLPARHLLELPRYERTGDLMSVYPVDIANTSRGCPFRCRYCSNNLVWGKKYRCRSAKKVVEEIKHLIETYRSKGIYFREDIFTVNKRRVYELCDLLEKENINIHWECESRVDTVDRDLLMRMHKAGCQSIWFGVESGVQRVLDDLGKGITLEQTKECFRWCHQVGIKPGASVMFGVPGEDFDDMRATLRFLDEIAPAYTFFSVFTAVPVSDLYQRVIDKNLIDSAYGHTIFIKTDKFDRRQVEEFVSQAEKHYHLNLKRLVGRIPQKGLGGLFKGGISLLRLLRR